MLTRRQKIVLRMYLAGFSVSKIAKSIGANVGMTYSIVKRLRNTKGVDLPYRRGRLDATVKTMLPKTTLFALNLDTGSLKKVAPPRPYNFRNHQIAKNIIGSIYSRLKRVEELLR